jgi:hypothetical protein
MTKPRPELLRIQHDLPQDLHRQRGFPGTGIPEQKLIHPVSGLFRHMAESPAFFIIRKKYRIRRSHIRTAAGNISKNLF